MRFENTVALIRNYMLEQGRTVRSRNEPRKVTPFSGFATDATFTTVTPFRWRMRRQLLAFASVLIAIVDTAISLNPPYLLEGLIGTRW